MTPQEEIRQIMLKHGVSYAWIAEKLGTYYQKILKKLNDQVISDIKDGSFTPDERIRMRYRLEDIKKEFTQTFDKLIDLTKGE